MINRKAKNHGRQKKNVYRYRFFGINRRSEVAGVK